MPKMCCDLALESLTSAIGGLPRADRFEGCAHAIEDGGPSGSRTLDLGIKSPLLCQLS